MNEADLDLIRKAKRGHLDAFTRLVHNYQNFVYRTAYGILRQPTDAEDVSQEVFLKVHQSLKQLRDERTFPTWLARITVRTAIDWKQRSSNQRAGPLDETRLATLHDPRDAAVHARLELHEALMRLTPLQRTVLVLRELHGLGYEEMAEVLGIPVGTVRSRLHNARAQLRAHLDEERGG
ncbi:MAG: sigma-70 family RNA polymerase sigma factor [Alicyclobacillus sp.]|nr:sigma-70 family RNA polymerase sigma factor [Alicyclobacillus sp.]